MNDAPADLKKKAISEMEEAMRKLAVWSNGGIICMCRYVCKQPTVKLDIYVFICMCACMCVCACVCVCRPGVLCCSRRLCRLRD